MHRERDRERETWSVQILVESIQPNPRLPLTLSGCIKGHQNSFARALVGLNFSDYYDNYH